MATHEFRIVQGNPCPKLIAPYIAIVANDAKTTVDSIYRGTDAESLLNAYHKHSQAQLWFMWLRSIPGANPANPPGLSTHELKSDGVAYSVPRGHDLDWWCQGFDVNDADVDRVIAAGRRYGWDLFRPYSAGSERHHLNFRREPKPTPRTTARILRLRLTLPRR